jgi:heme/copper-type cytochrome/quinol oxidase subunit 2
MQVVQWQWNFYVDPTGDLSSCYPVVTSPCVPVPEPNPPTAEITFQVGKTYKVMIVNADNSDVLVFHGFGGIPEIPELPRIDMMPQGTGWGPYTITPMIAGDFLFQCLATACGNAEQHEQMLGVIHVVP